MIITIANQQWKVQVVDPHHPGLMVDNVPCRGTTWMGAAEIYLSNELRGDQVARVIMHELTHAYIFGTQAVRPEQFSEEDICEFIAIYGLEISGMCEAIHQELYPDVPFRPFRTMYRGPYGCGK